MKHVRSIPAGGSVTGGETRWDVGHVESSSLPPRVSASGGTASSAGNRSRWQRNVESRSRRKLALGAGSPRRGIYKCGFCRIVSPGQSAEFIFCLSVASRLQRCNRWPLPASRLSARCDHTPFAPPFLRVSTVSIEKPPVSYYSPAMRHCARRTKRHEADPCLIRPRYSAISE